MKDFFNKEITLTIPNALTKKKKNSDGQLTKPETEQSEELALNGNKEEKQANGSSKCGNCRYRQYSWDYSWEKDLKQLNEEGESNYY